MKIAQLQKAQGGDNQSPGEGSLAQITIADMSPRDFDTSELIELLEKTLDFEDNQVLAAQKPGSQEPCFAVFASLTDHLEQLKR